MDLSVQELDKLPSEIGKLASLRTLVLGRWDKEKLGYLGNNLKTLPDDIGKLIGLRSLFLACNQFKDFPDIVQRLGNLRSLDLSGNQIATLPNSIGQLSNFRSLDLSGNQIATLPNSIGQLSNLRSLNLSGNRIATLPSSIGQLSNLRSLDLTSNQLTDLPNSIGQLPSLRLLVLYGNQLTNFPESSVLSGSLEALDLGDNNFDNLPETIRKLTRLKILVLSGNRLTNLPEDIGQLSCLHFLSLASNQLKSFPETISRLTSLLSLDLSGNQLATLPANVSELINLETLSLNGNQMALLPEAVSHLVNLRTLYLGSENAGQWKFLKHVCRYQNFSSSSNRLTSLPKSICKLVKLRTLNLSNNQLSSLPKVIEQLKNLQSLDLGSNQLATLPDVIGQLSSLTHLNLQNNQLTTLPDAIGQLSDLTSLNLWSNQLATLPDVIGQLSSLTHLNLRNNQLATLPDVIEQLSNLTLLDLSRNQLTTLPKWVKAFEKLDKFDLRGNPLPIPLEILGPKESWQSPSLASKTIKFYFSLQQEEGSTALYEAKLILVGEGGAGKTSLAKKIDTQDYELQDNEKSTEGIDVIRWDFSLPNGNIFRVNIWDFGGQEIYHATHQFFLTKRSLYLLVADTRQENTDFYYWLKIVELLSDSSPVLVIKNEKQDRQCEIDEGLFKSQFSNLKDYLPANLKDNRGLDKIKDAIRYHITQLPHVGKPLPKIWVRVRSALENYAQNRNTLSVEQYCDLCRQNGFTDKQQMLFLSSYLHDLGVCLHFQDDKLLKRTIVLKPEWATNAVYKVADSDTVRNSKGRFTEADTAAIWSDSEYSELRDELLQLMMRFKLAYALPNQHGQYIAPQLLPISKPNYPWNTADNLILRYTYDFMPKGILTRFIVETNQLIESQDHVWKNGVVLADNWARAQVIENYPKKEIEVKVSGSNKKPLLEKIRYELWKIHESYERLQYKERIPCNCSQCKISPQPESYPYDLLMKYVGDRRYDIECRASYEKVDVRRLISDISDQSARYDIAERASEEGSMNEPFRRYLTQPSVYIDRSTHNIQNDVTHQHGSGDNIARDKIEGDKIDSQINSEQDLTKLSESLDQLIEELSEEYNAENPRGQAKIQRDALDTIRTNFNLKARLTNAFKAGLAETLEQMAKKPLTKILIKSCRGFLENE